MAPKFGTSGLRGLVTELTPALVADYTRAFLAVTEAGLPLYLARDLRESSPLLAAAVAEAALAEGVAVFDCGTVPTPALALAAQSHPGGARAIMITGSHIPADRNGVKFYAASGEITKAHEAAILGALGRAPAGLAAQVTLQEAGQPYAERYLRAFPGALQGARIGLWSHSSVGRDLLADLLRQLGAEVTELGRSAIFIPVDTEAVDAPTRALLADWAKGGAYDALVSTDGDADRPLLADQTGEVIPGDLMGQVTAKVLGAALAVTPVSSNSGIESHMDAVRTRIGSPYVIAAMEAAGGAVVGYEANGGFLLGFDACEGRLPRLMTRDAVLPLVATIAAARGGKGFDLAGRIAREPARFTASNRIEEIPTERSLALLETLLADELARAGLLEALDLPSAHLIDTTDGLRMTLAGGTVLHLRPSGNAPEFRLYVEAASRAEAAAILARAEALLAERLR